MKFIRIGDLVVNLNEITTAALTTSNEYGGGEVNQVILKLTDGTELKFHNEAADLLREFFAASNDVRKLKPKRKLEAI